MKSKRLRVEDLKGQAHIWSRPAKDEGLTMSKIQWTEKTWNPVRGCSRVSPGCDSCYAMSQAHRFSGPGKPYEGLTVLRPKTAKRPGVDWSGKVRLVPEALEIPLRRKKPTTYFVNSMSDLFHESLSNEDIAAVFGVMAACPQHTFQCLTKRAKRMREWFEWYEGEAGTGASPYAALLEVGHRLSFENWGDWAEDRDLDIGGKWPLPNVWLGVSAGDQKRADERIPHLLKTPAAVRFVSAEPLLGPIDFDRPRCDHCDRENDGIADDDATPWCTECDRECSYGHWLDPLNGGIQWVIAGGESGHGAHICDVAWIRSTIGQCKAAGVACFVKQLGATPVLRSPIERFATSGNNQISRIGGPAELVVTGGLEHPKGGDMLEWPEDLRVRELPL